MGRRKGNLRKELSGAKTDKQIIREEQAAIQERGPAPEGGAGPSNYGSNSSSSSISDEPISSDDSNASSSSNSDAPISSDDSNTSSSSASAGTDESGMTESMRAGEGLINYAKREGLAVDLETMAPVVMPKGREQKLAACFPQSTQQLRDQYPLSDQPSVDEFLAAVEACLPGSPAAEDVTKLKELLVARRNVGGTRAVATLIQLKMQAQSRGDKQRALRMRELVMAVMKAESAITAPFRQAIKDAEARMAPHMGSPDVLQYAGNDATEATATFLCLKAVVAEWEKRYREMTGEELSVTDVLKVDSLTENKLDEERTGRIVGAVQQMSLNFSSNERLMARLTPEARFVERCLSADTTSEVRRIALQEFCPQEGISAEELRRRMRSLVAGLEALPRSSYSQLQIAVAELYDCLAEGTPDAYNVHSDNMREGGPLRYQTYDLQSDEPWRQQWRRIIRSSQNPARDFDGVFQALTPDLSGLFAGAAPKREGWLNMLEEERPDELQESSADDGDGDGWMNAGNDIYDDFERRYGLTLAPQEEEEQQQQEKQTA